MKYTILGDVYQPKASFPIEGIFQAGDFIPINLSVHNRDLTDSIMNDSQKLGEYISGEIAQNSAKGAYGGYAEKRNLYRKSANYGNGTNIRDIHIGLDIWMPADTAVQSPLPGIVHSFGDNNFAGDYGPTIILEHFMGNQHFYTLYGHLSRSCLANVHQGQLIQRGQVIGSLGSTQENGDWPPHLHFQIILDIGSQMANYPGVCSQNEKFFYLQNCPDPFRFIPEAWKKLFLE